LASPTTAVVLSALVVALIVADFPLAHLVHKSTESGLGEAVVALAFGLVGLLVAWRQPSHPMGWLLLGVALFLLLDVDASNYSVLDYRMHHGTLPLGAVAVLLQPSWAPAVALLGLTILLFPDGRLPSRHWKWVLWPYLVLGGLWVVGALVIAARVIIEHRVHIDSSGNLTVLNNTTSAYEWWNITQNAFFLVLVLSWLSWLVLQVVSFRRSTGERHEQLKWLMGGAGVCVVSLPLLFATQNSSSTFVKVLSGVALLGLAGLPVSIGVGILKYRLYEIDRFVSRTLSYAIVSGVVVGVYVGLITLVTRVLGFSSPVAVAASTLAAVALFNPLRHRVQRVVDRRFNRARYDAEATVAAFTARLRDAVDLETVRTELLEIVNRAVEPAHASVWIRRRDSA
jgi:hypothetical protein